MILKCKMCGGNIEYMSGKSVGKCDSCGTKQTLPILEDDRIAGLYDRANSLRRGNDFDKALEVYDQILEEKPNDPDIYWSIVLCWYGVEYVEDPYSGERIPTVNRTQFTSIFDNENYKLALKYADSEQRSLYREEAEKINKIQKDILAVTQKEDPYDVFICYKETDANGRRTLDSKLAYELYNQLTREGFRVFFSRVSLEDKIGTAYEPYIFGALKSANVMIVIGTKPEYFNAVWVRNEWSRFLGFMRVSSGKKILIPAYKDMDPYNLPVEFSHLQAQNMSTIGFEQDIIRGIKKYVNKEETKTSQQNGFDYGYEQELGRLKAQEDFKREQKKKEEEAARREQEAARLEEETRMAALRKKAEEKRLAKEKNEQGKKRYYKWLVGTGIVFCFGIFLTSGSADGSSGGSFGLFLVFVSAITFVILLLLKRFFYKSSMESTDLFERPVLITFPKGLEPFQDTDYMILMNVLRQSGFRNFNCVNMHDLVFGWFTKPGKVESVMVNGAEIDEGGGKYPADALIEIHYHGK